LRDLRSFNLPRFSFYFPVFFLFFSIYPVMVIYSAAAPVSGQFSSCVFRPTPYQPAHSGLLPAPLPGAVSQLPALSLIGR
jgi:hypothetical protein